MINDLAAKHSVATHSTAVDVLLSRWIWLFLWPIMATSAAMNCDPCIERSRSRLRLLIHEADPSRDITIRASQQAAVDMKVDLKVQIFRQGDNLEDWWRRSHLHPKIDDEESIHDHGEQDKDHRKDDAWIVSNVPQLSSLFHNHSVTIPPVFGMNEFNPLLPSSLSSQLTKNNNNNNNNDESDTYETYSTVVESWISQNHVQAGHDSAREMQKQMKDPQNHQKEHGAVDFSAWKFAFILPDNDNYHHHNSIYIHEWQGFVNELQGRVSDKIVVDSIHGKAALLDLYETNREAYCSYHGIVFLQHESYSHESQNGNTNIFNNNNNQRFVVEDIHICPHNATREGRTILGVITDEMTPQMNRWLGRGQLQFVIQSKYSHLQAALSVIWASLYVTTGKRLALPISSLQYNSGPNVITVANLPSDSYSTCQQEAFPVCDHAITAPSSSDGPSEPSSCRCTDRSQIRLAGVVHGHAKDAFWDPVFASAHQAAVDMGVTLDMPRFTQKPESNEILYEQMAARIRNLCDNGVDGIFVSIPSPSVLQQSLQRCLELRVPVISINSGKAESAKLGLMHHIGMDEYAAGYLAGQKMIEAGMSFGYCLDHAKGVSSQLERCSGFRDAIAQEPSVFFMGHLDVPEDNQERYFAEVEKIVEEDGPWQSIGLLALGQMQYSGIRLVKEKHPKAIVGMFDVNDRIYDGLDSNIMIFGIDQQPFLQGNMPVYQLTYQAYTREHLREHMIQSGPLFVERRPTAEQAFCEANDFEVCPERPFEDMNYIPKPFIGVGWALCVVLILLCLGGWFWTWHYRARWVVKVSQPLFLALVILGTLISSLSLVFLGSETAYRFVQDNFGKPTDEPNPAIQMVDAACMAVPWLYGLGFVITFSALFAKIQRVKLIYQAGMLMKRKKVGLRDVAHIAAAMLVIELAILISWQVVAPLRWEREVLRFQEDFPISSVGSCASGSSNGCWYFFLTLMLFHAMCLVYALVLCFQTKDINSDFAESSYLTLVVLFMFQILVVSVPISALVRDNSDVFYFVRASAIFLQNVSVLGLIFVPKMLKMNNTHRTSTNRLPSTGAASPDLAPESASRLSVADGLPFGDASTFAVALREESVHAERYSVSPRRALEAFSERSSRTEVVANTVLTEDDAIRCWSDLGFSSEEQAYAAMSIVKRSTRPKRRRKLIADIARSEHDAVKHPRREIAPSSSPPTDMHSNSNIAPSVVEYRSEYLSEVSILNELSEPSQDEDDSSSSTECSTLPTVSLQGASRSFNGTDSSEDSTKQKRRKKKKTHELREFLEQP